MYTYVYVNMYVYLHICLYINIYIHIHIYIYMYVYIHIYIYKYIYIYIGMCVCVCVYIHLYVQLTECLLECIPKSQPVQLCNKNGLALSAYCRTLQYTATHCNTLQHCATHCNRTATHVVDARPGKYCKEHILQWLQHTATHCNTLQRTTIHCNALHHTATRLLVYVRNAPESIARCTPQQPQYASYNWAFDPCIDRAHGSSKPALGPGGVESESESRMEGGRGGVAEQPRMREGEGGTHWWVFPDPSCDGGEEWEEVVHMPTSVTNVIDSMSSSSKRL